MCNENVLVGQTIKWGRLCVNTKFVAGNGRSHRGVRKTIMVHAVKWKQVQQAGREKNRGVLPLVAPVSAEFGNLKIPQIIIIKRYDFLWPHSGSPCGVRRRLQGFMGLMCLAVRLIGLFPRLVKSLPALLRP